MHPQEKQLLQLISKAKETEFGKKYNFSTISSYQEFAKKVPLSDYEIYKEAVERLKAGEENIFWPGKVHHFAVSSGTTGNGKHIPITKERLQSDSVFRRSIVKELIFSKNGYKLLGGKHISLPGSLDSVENEGHKYWIGEISGISSLFVPKWMQRMQILPLEEAINWTIAQKVEFIIEESIKSDIRSITGAPTWIYKVLQDVKQKTGREIKSLWPNFKVIITGGVAYKHYEQAINDLLEGFPVQILEMYGASEGYVGHSALNEINQFNALLNNGNFFELEQQSDKKIIPVYENKPDVLYSLLITCNTGLWRYPLKDTVMFDEFGKLSITGRVDSRIDYYGESLSTDEVRSALNSLGISYLRVILSPCSNPNGIVIFLETKEWEITNNQVEEIDKYLIAANRHYAIRRESRTLREIQIIEWTKDIEKEFLNSICDKAQLKVPEIITKVEFAKFLQVKRMI